ncbi:hypothetical protein IMSAGC010_00544 [Lactobacillus johnsonii]|nr:hypothetical protein IMSAGC010_00544 [Lactobacillus johnsonii]
MNINFKVLVQESFSSSLLGRIITINSSIVNCMIPIGSFLGGFIVKNYGARPAIILEGAGSASNSCLLSNNIFKKKKSINALTKEFSNE